MNQVAGMPRFFRSARMRAAPITPNSPRDTGVGVVMPRAIQPDMASKSNVMQTMCFATCSSLSAAGPTEHDRSIHAGAAFLRDSRALRDVGLDEFAELSGRVPDRLEAERRDALAHFLKPECLDDLVVQLRDNGLGRSRRREQPVPAEDVETREARFGNGGKLGREDRALRGRYGESADSPGAYLVQGRP